MLSKLFAGGELHCLSTFFWFVCRLEIAQPPFAAKHSIVAIQEPLCLRHRPHSICDLKAAGRNRMHGDANIHNALRSVKLGCMCRRVPDITCIWNFNCVAGSYSVILAQQAGRGLLLFSVRV